MVGIDNNMPRKAGRVYESRVGTSSGSARFPGEGGAGEKYMMATDRSIKQDKQRPAYRPGPRAGRSHSPVFNKAGEMLGERRNCNQFCCPCGEEYEGKNEKYYEYRRNRADVSRSKRFRKQSSSKKTKKYKTGK